MDLITPEAAAKSICPAYFSRKAAIAQTGAQSIKDMGKVMAALREKYAGQMDFAAASGVIKSMLA
ncbi:MAG: GatB/YqeY domain-containing protein [Alphaproteobacteria bacterium]|nr:GatB/YqeY domain-containing protein [Alphaproteobacteria bacterium]